MTQDINNNCINIAIITPVAPPSPSGQSRVLGAILEDFPENNVIILTEDISAIEHGFGKLSYIRLSPSRYIERILSILAHWLPFIYGLIIKWKAARIVSTLRRHPVQVIVGCTASPYSLPAAWLAADKLAVPFIGYLFDDPVLQWADPSLRSLAERWAPIWLSGAANLLVPNEVLAEDIRGRHGLLPTVLRNPAPVGAFSSVKEKRSGAEDTVQIVYMGSIYHAHFDAFHNLLNALPALPFFAELHIYTSQNRDWLESNGIKGQIVWHDHIDGDAVFAIERQADVLFLPLAFSSVIPEVIRSSAPGKMGEYLASGTPILAHVPPGSFVAEFLKNHQCGRVVDSNDVGMLVAALRGLVVDHEATSAMVDRALDLAHREFDLATVRRKFVDIVRASDRR